MGNLVNQHVRFIESGEFLTYPKPTGGNSLDRLIERKQMSTKTTFKRIALVAVAALGFGVLTSVAPANAAITLSGVTVGTPAPGRVNTPGNIPVTVSFAAGAAAGDTMTVGIRVISAPTGSASVGQASAAAVGTPLTAVAVSKVDTTGLGVDGRAASASPAIATNQIGGVHNAAAAGVITLNADSASEVAKRTSASINFSFTPDREGTYSFLVWVGGETFATSYNQASATMTTVGAPTAITITKYGVAHSLSTSSNGALLRVTMKDANGNATRLATGESLSITSAGAPSVTLTKSSLGTADESATVAGRYDFRAHSGDTAATTDGTEIVTVAGSGGLIPTTTTVNTSVSFVAVAAAAGVTKLDLSDSTGYKATIAAGNDYDAAGGASHVVKATVVADADNDRVFPLTITEGGRTYSGTVAVAKTKTSGTATIAGTPATGLPVTVLTVDADATKVVLSYVKAAAADLAVQGTTTVLSATAGTSAFTVKITDQYGSAMQYQAVSVAVSGRNTVASLNLGVTDANGLISYSLTDKGTTGTKDTVTFSATVSAQTAGANVAVINYGTVTVDSVTVSGGSKAETVAGSTLTAIDAADNGPEASYKSIKAVVKDASGNLLAGVPVTFTVDAGAIVKTAAIDYATVYTNGSGEATTRVFNWLVGKQTITATAGGKSSTDYLTWAATDASTARVLSATATGDIVSFKVVDRFGNAVKGVSIDLSRTGAGLFGSGKSTDTATTDKNGTADIRYIGSGTVVAELDADTYPQAADTAGKIDGETATAAVAGTTKGTGASLAPAGVAKVSIAIAEGADPVAVSSQAAADAAAEATDAANAATDAANAAAEAADAATAAAQDAADAVAALSTQVTELVSALRKQITSLTNLVIKIQKKVRA
jgi:trimeric autotransporter adhesin